MTDTFSPGSRIAAVLGCLAAVLTATSTLAAAPAKPASGATGGPPPPFYDGAYEMGSPKARVVVEEYASAVCPHCARFDEDVFPAIKARYVDTGKVRFVFREYLTEPAEVAASAFIIARCAGKAAYFKSVEEIFRAQPEMFSGRPGAAPVDVLMRIAKNNGVDAARFQACLADKAAVTALQARIDHAIEVDNVAGTPTVLINGRKVEPDAPAWTADKLGAVIDAALKASR